MRGVVPIQRHQPISKGRLMKAVQRAQNLALGSCRFTNRNEKVQSLTWQILGASFDIEKRHNN